MAFALVAHSLAVCGGSLPAGKVCVSTPDGRNQPIFNLPTASNKNRQKQSSFEQIGYYFRADFTLMGWLLRICPLDRLNIALCKQTEALSNRCASLAATDCIELAVLLQACNRLH